MSDNISVHNSDTVVARAQGVRVADTGSVGATTDFFGHATGSHGGQVSSANLSNSESSLTWSFLSSCCLMDPSGFMIPGRPRYSTTPSRLSRPSMRSTIRRFLSLRLVLHARSVVVRRPAAIALAPRFGVTVLMLGTLVGPRTVPLAVLLCSARRISLHATKIISIRRMIFFCLKSSKQLGGIHPDSTSAHRTV